MSKPMEFEVFVFTEEDLEDSTWVTIDVTEDEERRMLLSARQFALMVDDPSLSDLTTRVQEAVSDSGWMPFSDEETLDDFVLCVPDDYIVQFPQEISHKAWITQYAQRKQYRLKGLRWGYDGGGVTCGPIDGSKLVEAMVIDNDGVFLFVTLSRFTEFAKITLSHVSFFDILMHLPDMDLDFNRENKILEKLTLECYEFENSDLPEDMLESSLGQIFKVMLQAETHCPCDTSGEDFDGAQQFLSDYFSENADKQPSSDSSRYV